jgi:hypothetical protein
MTPRESSRRGALCAPALPGRTQTEARHDQRGQSKARGPNGATPRWKQTLIYGRAEPAPPREVCPTRIGCKGAIRSGRKPIFSEGRTVCARIERPSPCRGISLAEMARRAARAPIGRCPDEARAFLPGVRSPPLRGGLAQHGWPSGERSEMTPRESSRRGAVSAPVWQGRTLARVWHEHRKVSARLVAYGDMPGGSQSCPSGRAEPAPPGGRARGRRPSGEDPGLTRRAVFLGGTHSVRPRLPAGRL